MSERTEWVVLGRKIGTGTGWDASDMQAFVIYDFIPYADTNLPEGDLNFDMQSGKAQQYDDAGNETFSCDIIDAIVLTARV